MAGYAEIIFNSFFIYLIRFLRFVACFRTGFRNATKTLIFMVFYFNFNFKPNELIK